VFLLLLWKTALESVLKKNSFDTRKKFLSGSDCNGRILGKRKPFRVKQKVFLTEKSALDAMQ
jgi:hypothetical protein